MPRQTRHVDGSIIRREVLIRGRKAVRYDARRRYTKLDGSRGEKSKRCRSRSEAATQLVNFKNEIDRELAGDTAADRRSFEDLANYFEVEFIKPPVFAGQQQIGGYRQNLNALRKNLDDFRSFFGRTDLSSFGYEDVRRFAEYVATTPVRPGNGHTGGVARLPKVATVNRKLALLRRILNVGVQLRWLDRNPFTQGRRLINSRAEEPRERVLTFAEESRLLAACEDGPETYTYRRGARTVVQTAPINPRRHLRTIVIAALDTGLRKKELFTTRRFQVDLERHTLELSPKQTKALKRRIIPLSSRLEDALSSLFAAGRHAPNDLIFDGLQNCVKSFRTACKRAGIEDLHFHDLRHSCSTWMDEAGFSDSDRRNILGHGSVRVGQIYVNQSEDVLAAGRNKLDEFTKRREEKLRRDAA